jgi:hypothetical protein
VLLCVQVGGRFQGERALFLTRFGDELTWAGGARVDLVRRSRFDAAALAEVAGLVGPTDGTRPVEVRGGLRVRFGSFAVDLGAGGGVVNEVAAPAWRMFAILRHQIRL